jgi:hypothetical protein
MSEMLKTVKALHASYCARTGLEVVYNMARENTWREWLAWSGYTWGEKELALVIGYLKNGIRHGDRNEGALRFLNLIGHPDRFEEDLAFAKKWRRQAGPATARVRRQEPTPTEKITDAEAADLREQFKKTLDGLRP